MAAAAASYLVCPATWAGLGTRLLRFAAGFVYAVYRVARSGTRRLVRGSVSSSERVLGGLTTQCIP